MFLYENTNIKIDIKNTVTEVNVFLTVFDIPLKSHPPIDFIQEKAMHIFVSGNRKTTIISSITEINSSIEPFVIVAPVTFPLKIISEAITGAKALITLHKICK